MPGLTPESREQLAIEAIERTFAPSFVMGINAISTPDQESRGERRGLIRDVVCEDGTVLRISVEAIVFSCPDDSEGMIGDGIL